MTADTSKSNDREKSENAGLEFLLLRDNGNPITLGESPQFKMTREDKYAFRLPGRAQKAVSIQIDPLGMEYCLSWASVLDVTEVNAALWNLYSNLRLHAPHQALPDHEQVSFAGTSGRSHAESIRMAYLDNIFERMKAKKLRSSLEFHNEFFDAHVRKVRLADNSIGTKVIFWSEWDLSEYIPDLVNGTRVERKYGSPEISRFHNGQINRQLKALMGLYRQFDDEPFNGHSMSPDKKFGRPGYSFMGSISMN